MPIGRRTVVGTLMFVLLLLPLGAWALVKPVRVLAPELNAVSCVDARICLDEPSRYEEAARLYERALRDVERSAGAIEHAPWVTFCATQACFRSFGFDRAAGNTVATFGIVIGPRGWRPHYLRHELIHHLQNERLGSIDAWLFTPEWFIAGMAYSLSDDPRAELAEPWQGYRARFEAWYATIDEDRLWAEAARL